SAFVLVVSNRFNSVARIDSDRFEVKKWNSPPTVFGYLRSVWIDLIRSVFVVDSLLIRTRSITFIHPSSHIVRFEHSSTSINHPSVVVFN
ncbi:MAG TPA: hypothetical protein V6C97_00010, partial [Oculatellaceae cyanobacterium]